MFDFEKELEKFEPMLEVDYIEQNISGDEIKDIIDLLKETMSRKG